MANTDKDILITPNRGSADEPKIEFKGASSTVGPSTITATIYPTNNGTLSFDGTEGSLFSIANNLTTGSIFSVNPISGIPIIDVNADRTIALNPYGGNTGIGLTNPSYKLDVNGTARFSGQLTIPGNNSILFGPNSTWSRYLRIGGNGWAADSTTASVVTTDGNLHLDAADANHGIYLNWYGGTNGTFFGNGAAGQIGRLDGSGNFSVSGTITGTQITSNIANGTAPFVVSSTTKVTNLNADYLDDLDSGSFLRSDADDSASGIIDFLGGSGIYPAVRVRSGGNSWSEGVAIHPASDNGYALAYFRVSATLTTNTNTWGIGNLADNGTNNFALLRNGLTGSSAIRADAAFDVTQAGVFRFGFTPTVGSNTILHAGNYTSYVGNGTITVQGTTGLTGSGSFTVNQTGNTTITLNHADTSSQASVDNSNGTVIQDVTLDEYGHVTGLGSVDLDGRYYTESEIDGKYHDFQWRWIRYGGYVAPAAGDNVTWTNYFRTYFLNRSSATESSYPTQGSGYISTYDVGTLGGFGGSNYGNIFGDLENYHCHIYTHIYVEREFSINPTQFNGDDPHAIFINGVFVHGNVSCCTDTSYAYTFQPGWYRIDLIYAEGGGGDFIQMGWNPKDYTTYIKDMTSYRAPSTIFSENTFSSLKPSNNQFQVNINSPASSSGSWTTATSDEWGNPKFDGTFNEYRYADAPAWVQYNIPARMKSAWISQLTWDTGGYVDVHGIQSGGQLVFLRRINTRQTVENTDEGVNHDGSTITFAASGLDDYSAIRFTVQSGRFHFTGLSFSTADNEGTEGVGMVHPAQISHQGSGSGLDADTVDGLNPTSANTASTIVARDGSGNFNAGTITATLSGNASSATTFSTDRTNYAGVTDGAVSGQMMWKSYGNNHTIFDASAATSPQGSAVDRFTPANPVNSESGQNTWGYSPNLMGWNGTATYGLRVDYSRVSSSLFNTRTIWGQNFNGSANVSGAITGATDITATGEIQGTIFKDYNDTNYYGDFANAGLSLNLRGSANIGKGYTTSGSDIGASIYYGSDSSGYGRIRFYENDVNTQTIHAFSANWGSGFPAQSRGAININGANGVTMGGWNAINSTGHWFDNSGNGQSSASFRSPVFYDSDNTTYQFDGTGTTRLNTLRVFSNSGADWDAIQISTDGANGYIQGLGDETGLRIRSQYGNILLADDRGSVGIKNTSPLQALDVRGNFLLAADSTAATHITQKPYTINGGTLSWEGSAGQLFSITNNLTSGSIFSVNDVSGIPSIDVDANGTILFAPYGGNIGLGTLTPTQKLHVVGSSIISGTLGLGVDSAVAKLHTRVSTPTSIGSLPSGVTGILDSSSNNYLLFRNSADNGTYSGIAMQDNNVGGYVIFGNAGGGGDLLYLAGYGGGQLQYGTADSINPSARTTVASWNSTGLQINNGDLRAPIYRDSDDTNFYVNPANGGFYLRGGSSERVTYQTTDSGIYVTNAEGTGTTVRLGAAWGRPGVYNGSYLTLGSEDFIEFRIANTQVGYINSSGYLHAARFLDINDTNYYLDPATDSLLRAVYIRDGGLKLERAYTNNSIWFAGGTDDNHVLWNDALGGPGARGGSGFDGMKWNTYRGIYFRTGYGGQYNSLEISGSGANTNDHQVYLYGANDEKLRTVTTDGIQIQRDLYLSGSTGGNYGNRLIVGNTDTVFTLQDTNHRPTIQVHGQYPVVSLNHTVTGNTSHGPTLQFTCNGTGNQFVIGTGGSGAFLSMGYSTATDWNPHNGINGYNGTSFFHANSSGNIGLGAGGDWGSNGGGDPGYNLHFVGSNNATGGHAAFFDNRVSAVNGSGFLFRNQYGNHSWGIVAEYRVEGAPGADRPSILFSTGYNSNTWSVGYGSGTDDNFRINYDHGHRNGGWGTTAVLVDRSSIMTVSGEIRAPIFRDSNDPSNYYVDPNGTSRINDIYIVGGVAGVSNSSSYTEAAIEVRERGFGGAQDDTWATAPRIGFHWSGRVASQIALASNGRISILNNPGNALENFQCNDAYVNSLYSDSRIQFIGSLVTDDLRGLYFNGDSFDQNYAIYRSAGAWSSPYPDLRIDFHTGITIGASYSYGGTRFYNDAVSLGGSLIFSVGDGDGNVRVVNNLFVSTSNATGGGIVLADDGDIVDLNDGYCAMRFSSGVRIHSGNRTGSAVITLGSNGNVTASAFYGDGSNLTGITGGATLSASSGSQRVVLTSLTSGSMTSAATSSALTFDSSTGTLSSTIFTSTSDITKKTNIQNIKNAVELTKQINGVKFDWKETSESSAGVIAQEVEEVLPEIVHTNDEGIKSVNYNGVVGLLVEAIKEQQKQIDELKKELKKLHK